MQDSLIFMILLFKYFPFIKMRPRVLIIFIEKHFEVTQAFFETLQLIIKQSPLENALAPTSLVYLESLIIGQKRAFKIAKPLHRICLPYEACTKPRL
jgi:hypothetical protein